MNKGTYHYETGLATESGNGYVVHLNEGWQVYGNPSCRTEIVETIKEARLVIKNAIPWPDDPDLKSKTNIIYH